jgi:hypothetical protein
LALAVPLSRFTPRVGGGSAFFVRQQDAMKLTRLFLFSVLCLCLSGCMTAGVTQKGHGVPLTDDKGQAQKDDKGAVIWVEKPAPACYALVPLTVPVDIAFSPIELVLWLSLRNVH